jgi:hypothetical protein
VRRMGWIRASEVDNEAEDRSRVVSEEPGQAESPET